jgi:hypothetical protein
MSAGSGTRVTAQDIGTGDAESRVIKDDYSLVTDGDCYVHGVVAYRNGTHVITVKNVGGERPGKGSS